MHVTTISGEIFSASADRGGNLVATVFDFFTHFGNSKKITKKIHQFLAPFKKGLTPKHLEIFSHNSPFSFRVIANDGNYWQLLAIIGNYCCITNSPLLRHIIAKLFIK
jgi:hypothetical protein